MTTKNSKKLKESIAQYNKAIIAVFALFAFFLIFNFSYLADVSNIAHDESNSLCPEEVYPSFNLIFENTGQMETELCVEVVSDKLDFEEIRKCSQISYGGTAEFSFSTLINPEESGIESFEISYTWEYQKNMIQPKTYSTHCIYN